jgi:hypothetical protein
MKRYSGDPYWLTAKFPGQCAKKDCTDQIKKGDSIFYYPRGKKAFVGQCAENAAADFDSCTFDEMVYNS